MQYTSRRIEAALLWLGPVLLAVGFVSHRLWTQWPFGRMGELLLIALAGLIGWLSLLPVHHGWVSVILQAVPQVMSERSVLDPDHPHFAEIGSRGCISEWYSPALSTELNMSVGEAEWWSLPK
ncbi:hypothetical protein [Marilutibacter alkalisoli]|uniref:Uncharacterized protein n=1 Tax=Marilutibacter alkalisoli TaxID=2591633 RepID=A0A514BPR4_9GAMM|nr:hypothetical protein [Lysobacter alkalisoli]QDH69019.1 hypothetical protein FKV23_02050 [Lysobacter alkalisoli]